MFKKIKKPASWKQTDKYLLILAGLCLLHLSQTNILLAQAGSTDTNLRFNLHQPSAKVETNDSDELEEDNKHCLSDAKASDEPEEGQNLSSKERIALQEKSNEANVEQSKNSFLLQGGITYTVPRGTPIKLKMASVPSHPMKLMNHDMDGNLYPARLGQEITARTTEDIYVEDNKIIPEGTIFCGSVSRILPPRRVGRPGSLELSFNELITPDRRRFAFRAQADNFKRSTAKTKAKGFGIIAAHAAGGAIVGALVAYQLFGMEKTIAMHGYNIAGGAAGGALLATGYAIMRKGPKATLEPGDDLNMAIDTDLLMPVASEIAPKSKIAEIPALSVKIEKSKIENDGIGGHFVTVDATASNESEQDLSSIDLFLEDTNGNRYPLCSSPEEDSQFLFHLEPHSTKHLHLSFLTPYPKLKQQLVWLDHNTKLAVLKQRIQ